MDIFLLIGQCAPLVHPATMVAIVERESHFNLWAIGVNGLGSSVSADSKEAAVRLARSYIEAGYSVDLGLAQINSNNLQALNLDIDQAFDPCANIRAGQQVLLGFYRKALKKYTDEQSALRAALSAYNTGSFVKGIENGYVQKIFSAAEKYVGESLYAPEKETVGDIHRTNGWEGFTADEFRF